MLNMNVVVFEVLIKTFTFVFQLSQRSVVLCLNCSIKAPCDIRKKLGRTDWPAVVTHRVSKMMTTTTTTIIPIIIIIIIKFFFIFILIEVVLRQERENSDNCYATGALTCHQTTIRLKLIIVSGWSSSVPIYIFFFGLFINASHQPQRRQSLSS